MNRKHCNRISLYFMYPLIYNKHFTIYKVSPCNLSMLEVPLSVLVVHVHLYLISRQLAERSPYLEALQKEDKEVLFLYEPYDELVLMNLGQFYKKNLKSIENEITSMDKDEEIDEGESGSLSRTEAKDLMDWISNVLMNKVSKVKVSQCFYY